MRISLFTIYLCCIILVLIFYLIQIFLSSSHLILRKASVCCLRQLVQREDKEVREHAQGLVPQGLMQSTCNTYLNAVLPETGLEGLLFSMLDTETDKALRQDIKVSLIRHLIDFTILASYNS